jgi:hypothetical protein
VYAEQAIKKARGFGQRLSLSPWTEFDFLVRIAAQRRDPGELFYLLGLWPAQQSDGNDADGALNISRLFVDRLLATGVAALTPSQRIGTLHLLSLPKSKSPPWNVSFGPQPVNRYSSLSPNG